MKARTDDELSDSPYKECLNEVKTAKLDSDCDDFATPKLINKVSKIASKCAEKSKRKRTRQAPLRKFLENNLKHSDVNPEHLQMALALSESSYEAENPQSSQEKKETFKKAFEQFGFGYSKKRIPVETKRTTLEIKNKKSRYRYVKPILNIRTDEERQTLISSKVALILAENSRKLQCLTEPIDTSTQKLFKLHSLELSQLNAHPDMFYVRELGVEVCPAPCGTLLRDWRRIPGRDPTPELHTSNQNTVIRDCVELTPPRLVDFATCSTINITCKSGRNFPEMRGDITPPTSNTTDSLLVENCSSELVNMHTISDSNEDVNLHGTSSLIASNLEQSSRLSTKRLRKWGRTPGRDNESTNQTSLVDFAESCWTACEDGRRLNESKLEIGRCVTPPTLSTCDNLLMKNSSSVEKNVTSKSNFGEDIDLHEASTLLISNLEPSSPLSVKSNNSFTEFDRNGSLSPLTKTEKKIQKPSKYRLSPSLLSPMLEELSTNESAVFNHNSPMMSKTVSNDNLSKGEKNETSLKYEHVDLCSSDEDPVKTFEDTTLIYSLRVSPKGTSPQLDDLLVPEVEKSLKQDLKTPPSDPLQSPRKRTYSCVSPDIFGSDEEPSSSPIVTRLRGGRNIDTEEVECYDLTQSDKEESFHLNMSAPEDSIDRRSDLNVTDYVQNLLSQYKEEAPPTGRKMEKISTSDEESQPSQSSVYISDDELNYSSVFGTPHPNMNDLDEFGSALKPDKSSAEEPPISPPRKTTKRFPLSNLSPSKVSTPTPNLEDSFNAVLGQLPIDTPSTSTGSLIIKTKNVTPMANYDEMDTPKIVKELDNFGLKPLKRQKGVKLLKYIYESTHPVVNENAHVVKKRRTLEPPRGEMIVGDIQEECVVLERKQSKRVHSCAVPLHIAWRNFVTSNPKVRDSILLYEPLQLEVLHSMLKDQGFKFNIQDLLAFLDKKCITIRTAQGQHHGKKR